MVIDAFYVSPFDEGLLGTNNLCEALHCGVGYGPYGFTPCVLGTTLHRMFGYETIDTLGELTFDRCVELFDTYCQHCRWYLVDSYDRNSGKIYEYVNGYMSKTWKEKFEEVTKNER